MAEAWLPVNERDALPLRQSCGLPPPRYGEVLKRYGLKPPRNGEGDRRAAGVEGLPCLILRRLARNPHILGRAQPFQRIDQGLVPPEQMHDPVADAGEGGGAEKPVEFN